jgi:hypothetical protein
MTQDRAFAAGQNGGDPTGAFSHGGVPNQVHAPMGVMKMAARATPSNLVGSQADPEQLPPGNNPVLAGSECRDGPICTVCPPLDDLRVHLPANPSHRQRMESQSARVLRET